MTNKKNTFSIFSVWEDVFQSLNGFLNKNITVQVWKNWNNISWQERIKEVQKNIFKELFFCNKDIFQVAKNGHKVIISSPWYLDNKKYGSDWVRFYNLELETMSSMLIGGEVYVHNSFLCVVN